MGIILSGIQPTGALHLGNYLGAIRNWVTLQQQHECLFCIVDSHAITVAQEAKMLRSHILETAATYIACGIDPEKAIIFNQSAVSGHAELAWILNCHTPLGWLNRMTQFKEKAGKQKDLAVLGLYAYPVLMAADILLYKANYVPVGEDQKQHLELCRDIAGAFNRYYETSFFSLPEPLILETAARVMSLRDGTKKMSKSDPSEWSRITFADTSDTIAAKIRKAKTDPLPLPETVAGLEDRPEAKNLLAIYAALQNIPLTAAVAQMANKPFSEFKQELAEVACAFFAPIAEKRQQLLNEPAYLEKLVRQGNEKANAISQQTMQQVREVVGLFY